MLKNYRVQVATQDTAGRRASYPFLVQATDELTARSEARQAMVRRQGPDAINGKRVTYSVTEED